MCYEINLYESVKKPKVKSTITTDALFEIIRSGGSNLELINKARNLGKQHVEYQDIKTNLPAVTWSFLFEGYKKDKNIINSTGLIYYDIDVALTMNLNTDYIFAKYQSLSNVGSTIIVKVSGVTINNFSATYCAIANKLGIIDLIDSNASKRTQFNVISYDPNIFTNNESFCFSAETMPEFEEPKLNTANENQKNVKWRYDNYADYCKENDTQEYEFGVPVVSLYLPSTIKNGKRKHLV